jgi:hypothetical protein
MSGSMVYICDWLPPDFGAVGQYSLGFARAQAAIGHHVVLIGLSSEGDSRTTEPVEAGCLTVIRLKAPNLDRARLGRRLRWTLVTNLRLLAAALFEAPRVVDILITGSPPFLLHFVVPLNFLLHRRLIYRITDFHPECLMATYDRVPIWLRSFHRLTCALRRRVDVFEVLGLDQARRLQAIGIRAERIVLKRDPVPITITGLETRPEAPPGAEGRQVLLYSGNWGVAHDVDTFVGGYIRHHRQGSRRMALWLNAVGAGADRVEARLRSAEAPVARTCPVPLELLPGLLLRADAHLITLKETFVGYAMPSKVHGCVASRRPVLFVGSESSDVDLLCREGNLPWYARIPVGDIDGCASALEALADHGELSSRADAAPSTMLAWSRVA